MWRQPTGDGMTTAVLLQPITLSAKKVAYCTLRDISCNEDNFTLKMFLTEVGMLLEEDTPFKIPVLAVETLKNLFT